MIQKSKEESKGKTLDIIEKLGRKRLVAGCQWSEDKGKGRGVFFYVNFGENGVKLIWPHPLIVWPGRPKLMGLGSTKPQLQAVEDFKAHKS